MENSTTRSSAIRSMLADEAMAALVVPWACPCTFGQHGRYVLESLVSMSGRSFVYRARDVLMSSKGFDATVAVKITLAGQFAESDALLARRVSHPNVLQVLDRGVDESGAGYVVTEWMSGGTLADVSVPWEPRRAGGFVSKLARGVQAAHLAGVIHCDLKPSNVLLTESGEPKVADFDLAFAPALEQDPSHRGNMAFMSPEQFEGTPGSLAPAADVYALGGILFWLLTGRLPHGELAADVVAFHRRRSPIPNTGMPTDLDAICRRALSRDIALRHQAAASLADDLDAWLAHKPLEWNSPGVSHRARLFARRNPGGLSLAAAAAVTLTVGGFFAYDRTVGARDRQLETNRVILERSQAEVNALQSRIQMVVRVAAASIVSKGMDTPERMFPALYWLDWFRGRAVLSALGTVDMPTTQISNLERFIRESEQRGTDSHMETCVARFVLIGYLIDTDRGIDVTPHMERLKQVWGPTLAATDPIWESIAAYQVAAKAQSATFQVEQFDYQMESVRGALEHLEAVGGPESVRQVLQRYLRRMERGRQS